MYPDIYLCDKAMRHILAHQDDKGSFGSILANIQVTPALLGESLISLKNYDCPVGKLVYKNNIIIDHDEDTDDNF